MISGLLNGQQHVRILHVNCVHYLNGASINRERYETANMGTVRTIEKGPLLVTSGGGPFRSHLSAVVLNGYSASSSARKLRVTIGSTLTPGPMVEASVTDLT